MSAASERFVLRVALNDHQVLVDDRRARGAAHARGRSCAPVFRIPRSFFQDNRPSMSNVRRSATEERDDATAVGGRRGVGVRRLDVALFAGTPSCAVCRQATLACPSIERHHDPAVHRLVWMPCPHPQARFERRIRLAADRRSDMQPIPQTIGLRMREPRHFRGPAQVAVLFDVPAAGQSHALADAGREGTTK